MSSPADAPGHITAAYDLLIADAEVEGSIWVESASYTVLAMLTADPTAYAAQSVDLVRRISQHRNSLGAFHSTQVCELKTMQSCDATHVILTNIFTLDTMVLQLIIESFLNTTPVKLG